MTTNSVCTICNRPISEDRLQMLPRVITCSPGCTRENKLAKGRLRAKRQHERRTKAKETEAI